MFHILSNSFSKHGCKCYENSNATSKSKEGKKKKGGFGKIDQ